MSVEAIIGEIEAKISSLSGLPPDLSEQYGKLRTAFAYAAAQHAAKVKVVETKSKAKKSAAKK